jgi:hypothetical protein
MNSMENHLVTSIFALLLCTVMLGACAVSTPTESPTATPTQTQTPSPGTLSISGRVWHDLCALSGGEGDVPVTPSAGCAQVGEGRYQANGLLESTEPGLGGVLVQLGEGDCPATGLATARTGMDGRYV